MRAVQVKAPEIATITCHDVRPLPTHTNIHRQTVATPSLPHRETPHPPLQPDQLTPSPTTSTHRMRMTQHKLVPHLLERKSRVKYAQLFQ